MDLRYGFIGFLMGVAVIMGLALHTHRKDLDNYEERISTLESKIEALNLVTVQANDERRDDLTEARNRIAEELDALAEKAGYKFVEKREKNCAQSYYRELENGEWEQTTCIGDLNDDYIWRELERVK
jgi:F0F1-type ATP synthase membrane subunit b/b'